MNNTFDFIISKYVTQTDFVTLHDSKYPHSLKITFYNSIFYNLERVPLNKHNYQHELNIMFNTVQRNNFNLNATYVLLPLYSLIIIYR